MLLSLLFFFPHFFFKRLNSKVADLIWMSRLNEADEALLPVHNKHPYPAALYVLSSFWRAILSESKAGRDEAVRRIGTEFE